MIQVDMSVLTERYYQIGLAGGQTKEEIKLFASLDQWQRQELKLAFVKGVKDAQKEV